MVMLVEDSLSVSEVEQCLKEVMEVPASLSGEIVPIYPVLGHPLMWPDVGFIEFISPSSFFGFCLGFIPCRSS
jgi:hypothetical protein